MLTSNPAKALGLQSHGLAVGNDADLVLMDTHRISDVILDLPARLMVLKRGRVTASSNSAATSAGGITSTPRRKKLNAPTCSPSRRIATSHSSVAREPVIDRFGPRSTPISKAAVVCRGSSTSWPMEPAIRPVGRLFIRLPAMAEITPAAQLAVPGDCCARAASICASRSITPVDQPDRGHACAKGRQTQRHVQCRYRQQQGAGEHQAQRAKPGAGRQGAHLDGHGQWLTDALAHGQAQHQVGHGDGAQRGQGELAQPFQQRWHLAAEDHQVGRVGDRQHEAGGIGDEGADEQVEQALARAPGMLHRVPGQPVEQAFLASQLGQHHHAGEEQVDIASFGDCRQGQAPWDQAAGRQP
ncbi:hypothetical protein WR25_15310 [Diploscapter pachys]|uniref:Uncharacterized protein n=1 Tax=Diploscapter pachys TaxID=2018661 RepID=A0A2A2K9U6_9BILA|nr:hypothetical protein WR25_15310 [Diploscapter pachys]